MKLIYKIFFVSMLFTVVSCYELDLQENPNAVSPEQADINFLFNNVQLDYAQFNFIASEFAAPVVRQTAMTGGNVYLNQYGPGSFNGIWNIAYAGILPDIQAITDLANETGQSTHLGIVQIMKGHVLMTLVDLFGDVPYTEALQGTANIAPKADAGKDVYTAALALLNEGITNLGVTAPAPGNDYFLGGSTAAWINVANTLKIKYYLNLRLTDSAGATAGINEVIASGNFIAGPGDDYAFSAGTTRDNPDSRHFWYRGAYETGGQYMSNYYMWSLLDEKGFTDPRLRYYFYRQDCDTTDEDQFTLDCPTIPAPLHYTGDYPWCVASTDGWWGRDHGNNDGIPPDNVKRTVFGLYPAGGKFDANDCASAQNSGADGAKGEGILPILISPYTHFMLAESALTLGTTGDARTFLEDAVRLSFDKVRSFEGRAAYDFAAAAAGADSTLIITDTKIDNYVNFVLDAYDNAGSEDDRLGVIIKEYHIASYGAAMEAYNAYRRTSHPKGMQPTREPASGDFTRSMWYPSNFVDQNSSASQKSGVGVKVFWDTNPDALD